MWQRFTKSYKAYAGWTRFMTAATMTHGYAAEPPTNPLRREITSIGWVQDGGPLLTLLPTVAPQTEGQNQEGRARRIYTYG